MRSGISESGIFRVGAFIRALLVFALVYGASAVTASAQSFSFSSIEVQGNERIEDATVLSYANVPLGRAVSAASLNDSYQRVLGSGLFETVDFIPRGSRLVIRVREYPTINVISIEGNDRLDDTALMSVVQSRPRRVYSPSVAERDAAAMVQAYETSGRLAASVSPKIIRRTGNRVDLVFEVVEGGVVEVERISFVGNETYSDRRLRRELLSKQAGPLRQIIQRDTFIADRIAADRQALTDFYLSRGYPDFQILSVSSQFARERNAFFITFNIREGQKFEFGRISVTSEVPGIDVQEYRRALTVKPGVTYSQDVIDNQIARLERLAVRQGIDFVRVEPQTTRNSRERTLDVNFRLVRGPRIFVERIDIEGNQTTLDRVIRRQFDVVEGDPFNPREIRETSDKIRGTGFFSRVDVAPRQGSAPDQVIVDVDVEEQPTGSFSFGGSYGVEAGFGLTSSFSERNFLGRGQTLSFNVSGGAATKNGSVTFIEPAFLSRDVTFRFDLFYSGTSEGLNATYSTSSAGVRPSFEFPVSEYGRLALRYELSQDELFDVSADSSAIIQAEEGALINSSLGYTYSFDTRRRGLNPNAGVLLRFGQDVGGVGGDSQYLKSTALASAQALVLNEEVTLRATVEGGALEFFEGTSRVTDRFFLSGNTMRGFQARGLGPRDLVAVNQDGLGGNYFAVTRLESEFPLGLPEEYGLSGGVFLDIGTVWGLENTAGGPTGTDPVDDSLRWRSAAGVSLLWTSPIGPLRFNFSRALLKEDYDLEKNFDLTISTQF
ncbi:MAG: outer membrane protein assembly factor BamA [Rhodobacteraceae bacterium]|nr:outer membrane protein assembly factor BamA [Paracoccaceae bacterium]